MSTHHVFEPYQLKNLTLKNRILMAPMTRVKAGPGMVPTKEMASYYARRANAGLIITEGTVISVDAIGHRHVPGIYNDTQVKAWQEVTQAVHQEGGRIFSQIWHVGRVSHPDFLEGKLPISASETVMNGRVSRSEGLHYGTSRAASSEEIKDLIHAYRHAAENAMKAGFDGVEIHGANGYLIDQFLHYHTNLREDEYGGSIENRARFALEVIRACGEAIGFEQLGIRLSPAAYLNEITANPKDADVFKYLLQSLNHCPIAYVHTGNFNDAQVFEVLNGMTMTQFIRSYFKGTVVAAGGYTFASAEEGIQQRNFDLVAIGRPFIANPDLIERFQKKDSILAYDPAMLGTLY